MFYPFDFKYHLIDPSERGTVLDQLNDCLHQVRKVFLDNKEFYPLSFNWFFDNNNELDCDKLLREIESSGITEITILKPTVIAQAPANGNVFQIVICSFHKPATFKASYPMVSGHRYALIESPEQLWAFISVDGCQSEETNTREKSVNSFRILDSILQDGGFRFTDIIRQWNYIPDIVGIKEEAGSVSQNYQEFNEVRGEWYRDRLVQDYPAATGIGTRGMTIRLQVIAVRIGEGMRLISLKNPVQHNAHQYSEEKLVGTVRKSAPLFERGKLVFWGGQGYIWVSGTAAIRGEESVKSGVHEQTKITSDNIDKLIDKVNLKDHGLDLSAHKIAPVYVRAYVKYRKDGRDVQDILENRYPGALIHVLEGDVCRDELLVEVEAEFSIRSLNN